MIGDITQKGYSAKKAYSNHRKAALLRVERFLEGKNEFIPKHKRSVKRFAELNGLMIPTNKSCIDWIIELYLSETNDNCSRKISARAPRNKYSKKERYKHPDEEELDSFQDDLDKLEDEKMVLYGQAKQYLITYCGYREHQFEFIGYVKVGDVKKFLKEQSPIHVNYLKSVKWAKIKQYVREKFNYHCQECGKNMADDTYNLHTHHLSYDRLGDEDLDKDLTLLCRDCHNAVHSKKKINPSTP